MSKYFLVVAIDTSNPKTKKQPQGCFFVYKGKTPNTCCEQITQRCSLLCVYREALAQLGYLSFHAGDNRIRIACFQCIKNIADPVGQLHALSFAKTAGGNCWRTYADTGGHKG